MPAEWERHEATWIAWPHHEPDWPGKLGPIPWVYAEIVRVLHNYERVEILCHNEAVRDDAQRTLSAHSVSESGYRLHLAPTDRVWLRDSAPTGVQLEDGSVQLINWGFNGWAKYDNYANDAEVGKVVEKVTGLPRLEAERPDNRQRLVLEGGGIECDGAGTLLVSE
jgi:agmatine deiminase